MRPKTPCLSHLLQTTYLSQLLLLTSLTFIPPSPAFAHDSDNVPLPVIDKKDLRYDGKDFAYWRNYLMTELKEERQLEAVKALGAFARRGHGREAATSVIQFAERYDMVSSSDISDTVTAAGEDGLLAVIDGLKRKRARPFCNWHLSSQCQFTPAAYRALFELLAHDDWQVRVTAAGAMGIQQEGRAKWLDDAKTRRDVAAALGKVVADRRFGVDGDRDAVRLLGSLGADAAGSVPALLYWMKTPPTREYSSVPCYAALALGDIGQDADSVVPALVAALDSKSGELRSAAAQGLGKFGAQARKAAPRLWAVVKQRPEKCTPPSPSVIQPISAPATLPKELVLEDPEVYVDMVIALSQMGEPAAKIVPRLAPTLDWNLGPDRRARILEALARMGPAAIEALPAIEKMSELRGNVPEARDAAIRAIKGKEKD